MRVLAGLLTLAPAIADAVEYETRGLQTLVNFEASYGMRYRLESPDSRLIGLANGGDRNSVNSDDGTQNYAAGVASQMVRVTGEAVALYGNVALYGRAAAFRDWEQDGDLRRTGLSHEARDLVGSGAELLDHYLGFSYTVGGVPVYLRAGDQVVSWSGSTFLRDGLDLINPIDFATAGQPAGRPLDSRIPQGMLWMAASLTPVVALEGYYQYEWKPAVLPPLGSYLSGLDAFGGDGLGAMFSVAGRRLTLAQTWMIVSGCRSGRLASIPTSIVSRASPPIRRPTGVSSGSPYSRGARRVGAQARHQLHPLSQSTALAVDSDR
ncbi:MAG: DUF1302 domain-containing protein [Gammaproteobacteria bacterium]|nr:DUF1302 domain-containing protein [Gammaproteobacteria bacterium]